MLSYLWVSLGGAIGSAARFWISGMVAQRYGQTFPLGTLTVNVTGSFIIGLFAALTDPDGRWLVTPSFREFFMIGVCGGYTTFSSFQSANARACAGRGVAPRHDELAGLVRSVPHRSVARVFCRFIDQQTLGERHANP